jgi:hypothetical protein
MRKSLAALVGAMLLAVCPCFAQSENKVETGTLNGAAFRIEIPANWNRGLVMYCHGYHRAGTVPNLDSLAGGAKPLRDALLARGFAVAQSAYSAQGWAVKELFRGEVWTAARDDSDGPFDGRGHLARHD